MDTTELNTAKIFPFSIFRAHNKLRVGKSPEPLRFGAKSSSLIKLQGKGKLSPAERKSKTCGDPIEPLVSYLREKNKKRE
jgi:hypothetical protein